MGNSGDSSFEQAMQCWYTCSFIDSDIDPSDLSGQDGSCADGWFCDQGYFCNFDLYASSKQQGSSFCEACADVFDCFDDGLPALGAADCDNMCKVWDIVPPGILVDS